VSGPKIVISRREIHRPLPASLHKIPLAARTIRIYSTVWSTRDQKRPLLTSTPSTH